MDFEVGELVELMLPLGYLGASIGVRDFPEVKIPATVVVPTYTTATVLKTFNGFVEVLTNTSPPIKGWIWDHAVHPFYRQCTCSLHKSGMK